MFEQELINNFVLRVLCLKSVSIALFNVFKYFLDFGLITPSESTTERCFRCSRFHVHFQKKNWEIKNKTITFINITEKLISL